MYTNSREKRYNIGGVFDLTLIEDEKGFIGEYKKVGSGQIYIFDGSGMTKKKILTTFWNKVRKIS